MMDAVETAQDMWSSQGRELGRYWLIAELARGGMGVVFLALVRGPGGFHKLFVVKELKAHLAEDPSLVSMFVEEACLAAKLNHPNIVQTIEVGSDRGRHFIAMEYLDGQAYGRLLARLQRAGKQLPTAAHLYVLSHLLEGLAYAHGVRDFDGRRLSLVHRDVSPQNVLLTYDGQVKIIDFGIAKALESAHETQTGVLKGKIAYMAPEQAAGEPIDCRADIFSAGVMLWEAAVGQRMWSREANDMRVLHALLSGDIPRPAEARPDIDPEIERMILKATAASAGDRYASAAEFQADIDNHLRWLGEAPFGPREAQALLGKLFAEERASIQALIDEEVRSSRSPSSGTQGLPPPTIPAASPRSLTPPGVLVPTSGAVAAELETAAAPTASAPPLRSAGPDAAPPTAAAPRGRHARAAVLALGAGVVLAGAAVAWRSSVSLQREAAASAGTAGGVERASPVASDAPGASPSGEAPPAVLFARAPEAPVQDLPDASAAPVVRPPHAPSRPAAVASGAAAASAPAQPATPTGPVVSAAASGRVKQQIDTRDPYADEGRP
jgi:serine/threonine-protein kinase